MILRAIEGVPLDVQRRLADGEPVPIYLPGEDGPKSLPLSRIPSAAITRVIADGIVRTPAEQRLAIRANQRKRKTHDNRKYAVTVDRETRTLKVGKVIVPIATVVAAMAEAAGMKGVLIDDAKYQHKTVAGKVTDEEKDRLKAAAKAHGLEEWEMVRRAVVAMWLL